jgi:SAM-dependent methyltransferase
MLDFELESYVNAFYENIKSRYNLSGIKILEIGCGWGGLVKTIAHDYPSSEVFGIDPFLKEWWRSGEDSGQNYSIIDACSELLPFDEETFDLVISIAAFEHVNSPVLSLREIKRVLKSGGSFFTHFGPVWSSIAGHHYYHWDDTLVQRIPPWGHLYMTFEEMFDHLCNLGIPRNESFDICKTIYQDPIINRVSSKQFDEIFNRCGMSVTQLEKYDCPNRRMSTSGLQDSELSEDIQRKLFNKYTREELLACSYTVECKK